MVGGIVAAVVGVFIVAAVLLSDSDGGNVGSGFASALATLFGLLLLGVVIAARIGVALASLSILLKLLGVMPVAAWSWGAILGSFFGLIVFLVFVVAVLDD